MEPPTDPSPIEVFVPGRLCITGEHTDWMVSYRLEPDQECSPTIVPGLTLTKGVCVVCTTNEGLYAQCSKGTLAAQVYFESIDNLGVKTEFIAPMDVDQLKAISAQGTHYSYIAGTTCVLLERYPSIVATGIAIRNYKTTLPMKKGLSSSAAVCVLVAECFSKVYGLNLSLEELMDVAYAGEWLTPSECGRMDQCVAMGAGRIGVMLFDGVSCKLQPLFVAKPLYFVVVDLKAGKNTVNILRDLNACFKATSPTATQRLLYEYHNDNIPLSERVIEAVKTGDIASLADCITQAQSNFDRCAMPNCLQELTSPRLHSLLCDARLIPQIQPQQPQALALAGKGVGSQGDGSMQLLCVSQEMQSRACELLNSELGCDAFPLTIVASES